LSESKLYHVCWVSQVKIEVIPYSGWGCFPYQSRVVVVRVKQIAPVKTIVRVKDIPCTMSSPESILKQCHIIREGASHIRVDWLSEGGIFSESK
jgi:hypothetical protein